MRFATALLSAAMVTTFVSPRVAAAASCDDGCWVQVWEDKNFHDDNDRICGPGKWGNMRKLPGANKKDWGDKIESLKTGPNAEVTVWKDEDFKGDSLTVKPDEEKPNLMGEPDLGKATDSMEIKCK